MLGDFLRNIGCVIQDSVYAALVANIEPELYDLETDTVLMLEPFELNWWEEPENWGLTVLGNLDKVNSTILAGFKEAAIEWHHDHVLVNKISSLLSIDETYLKDSVIDVVAGDAIVHALDSKLMTVSENVTLDLAGNSSVLIAKDNVHIRSIEDESTVHSATDNVKIRSMVDEAHVEHVSGNVVVDTMAGNSSIGAVRDTAKVRVMYGNSKIGTLEGNAFVECVAKNSEIALMSENSRVKFIGYNSKVLEMCDNATVEELFLATVGDIKDNAKVEHTVEC